MALRSGGTTEGIPLAQLDRTNLQLLELLQKDARTSITDLARSVNRAESTVRERIGALERDGVLRGYRALVSPQRLGYDAHAVIRADCDLRRIPEITKALEAIPQVTSAALTTGPRPLVVELRTENLTKLEQLLEKKIGPLELRRMEVAVVLNELVEPRPMPLVTPVGTAAPAAVVSMSSADAGSTAHASDMSARPVVQP